MATKDNSKGKKRQSSVAQGWADLLAGFTKPVGGKPRTAAQMKAGSKNFTAIHGDPGAYAKPTFDALKKEAASKGAVDPASSKKVASAASRGAAAGSTGSKVKAAKPSVKKAAGDGALAGGIGAYGTGDAASYITLPGAPGAGKTAAAGFKADPNVAKLIAAIGGSGGLKKSTFKGDLADYVAKYKAMMPTTDYGALIGNAQDQAATGDKKIQGDYNGLSAFINGQANTLTDQSAASAKQLSAGTQSAVDILNSAYDASRKSVSDQLANIGGLEGVNPDPSGTSQAHQVAAAGDMAQRLQTALTANSSDLSSRLSFGQNASASAQMQGTEQRANLQRDLAKMVAQYRTQESQENASNASQALSLGTNQFNTDRSYAQSEASRAQDAANQAYAQRANAANMAISQDNTRYGRFRDQVSDEQSAAQQRYAAAVDAAKFRYSQQQDAASSEAASAKFQYQIDQDAQARADKLATAAAVPQGLSKVAATLWSSTYNAVLNKTGKLTQAQAAANTAVKNAGY